MVFMQHTPLLVAASTALLDAGSGARSESGKYGCGTVGAHFDTLGSVPGAVNPGTTKGDVAGVPGQPGFTLRGVPLLMGALVLLYPHDARKAGH